MFLDLSHPRLDSGEGLSVSDVVGHDNSVSTLVVGGGDGLESLLTGSVPDLQLDSLALDIDGPNFLRVKFCLRSLLRWWA